MGKADTPEASELVAWEGEMGAYARMFLPSRPEVAIRRNFLWLPNEHRMLSPMSDEPFRGPKAYHGFGGRLFHDVPNWVREDAVFHIRVRCAEGCPLLTEPNMAGKLLESVRFYQEKQRWWVHLFLLMPDHWHALLRFGSGRDMGRTIGDWKRFHAQRNGVVWQENYFDHRLRDHLEEFEAKWVYIWNNPVVAGLCARVEDWPWQWSSEALSIETRPK
jgi:hypothetical protein